MCRVKQRVTDDYYAHLIKKLRKAITEKQQGISTKGVFCSWQCVGPQGQWSTICCSCLCFLSNSTTLLPAQTWPQVTIICLKTWNHTCVVAALKMIVSFQRLLYWGWWGTFRGNWSLVWPAIEDLFKTGIMRLNGASAMRFVRMIMNDKKCLCFFILHLVYKTFWLPPYVYL